eukprot:478695-Amphidinium_carterae.1
MAATTKQVRELVSEMQRMAARLQAAAQIAADVSTRVQQAEQAASAAADQAAAAQRQQVAQMYGTQDVSQIWQKYYAKLLGGKHWKQGDSNGALFYDT